MTDKSLGSGEMLSKAFGLFGQKDINGILDCFSEDAVIRVPGVPGVPFVGTFGKPSERRAFFTSMFNDVNPIVFDLHRVVEDGDDAIALASVVFGVARTGQNYATDVAVHVRVKDGHLILWQAYEDSHAIGEAFGLARHS